MVAVHVSVEFSLPLCLNPRCSFYLVNEETPVAVIALILFAFPLLMLFIQRATFPYFLALLYLSVTYLNCSLFGRSISFELLSLQIYSACNLILITFKLCHLVQIFFNSFKCALLMLIKPAVLVVRSSARGQSMRARRHTSRYL